jgi:hypothetical protein
MISLALVEGIPTLYIISTEMSYWMSDAKIKSINSYETRGGKLAGW